MLVLTVTRQCELRCAYCRTAQDGWPSLSARDCERALDLYVRDHGGGDVKLHGGEPLLVPETTRAAIAAAQRAPEIRRVYLSTNGAALDAEWLRLLEQTPKLVLTLSLDGRAADHDRFRPLRQAPNGGHANGSAGSFHRATALLEQLLRAPRVVITQTIPPQTAARAHENLAYLLELGFHRFNLLPAYFRPWTPAQRADLRAAFEQVARLIIGRWERGQPLYLRNLYTWAPAPFFNRGFVVDADGSIHPTNMGLWAAFEGLLEETRLGDLDHPPTPAMLAAAQARLDDQVARTVEPALWEATRAVDSELTRLCERLYPALIRYRKRSRGAA